MSGETIFEAVVMAALVLSPQVGGKVTSCLLSYFVSSFGLERGVA